MTLSNIRMVAVLPVDKEQYSYSKWLLWSSNLRTAYAPTNTFRPNHVIDSCGVPILGPHILLPIHFVLILLNHVIDSCDGRPMSGPHMLLPIHFVLIMLLIVVVVVQF